MRIVKFLSSRKGIVIASLAGTAFSAAAAVTLVALSQPVVTGLTTPRATTSSAAPAPASTTGSATTEEQAAQLAQALTSIFNSKSASANANSSSLLGLYYPLPMFTIEVTTNSGVVIDYPAVIGITNTIVVPNTSNPLSVPQLFDVSLTAGGSSSGSLQTSVSAPYQFEVKHNRSLGATCDPTTETGAKVAAIISLANPLNLNLSGPTLTIGVDGRARGTLPEDFLINFNNTGNALGYGYASLPSGADNVVYTQPGDPVIGIQSTRYCGYGLGTPKPIDVVAEFRDDSVPEDIHLKLSMASDNTTQIGESTRPIGTGKPTIFGLNSAVYHDDLENYSGLWLTGTRSGFPMSLSVVPLPQSLGVCSDSSGNGCAEDWRTSRGSLTSIQVISTKHGSYRDFAPLTVNADVYNVSGSNMSHVVVDNLKLTYLGMDGKMNFSVADLSPSPPPLPGSAQYPKWAYVNTYGQSLSGHVRTEAFENAVQKHYTDIQVGITATKRELGVCSLFVPQQANLYPLVTANGSMSCPGGFSITSDQFVTTAGAAVAGSIMCGLTPVPSPPASTGSCQIF